jgi:monoamine oxidase
MDKGGKLFLKFKQRLWDSSIGFINLDKSKLCQEYWVHNSHAYDQQTDQHIILAALVTDQTHYNYIRQVTNQDLKTQAILELSKALSIDCHLLTTTLLDVYFHDWGNSPFIGGMYSYPNLLYKDNTRERTKGSTSGPLHFTGEYTHPSDFATIHGSIEQAILTTQQVLKYHHTHSNTPQSIIQ